jgi:hypothetical protein
MNRYDFTEATHGEFVEFEDAARDMGWLVDLIRKAKINGTMEEFSIFDEIVSRWELDTPD